MKKEQIKRSLKKVMPYLSNKKIEKIVKDKNWLLKAWAEFKG